MARIDIAHPFAIDGHGDIATADYAAHVRQLIQQVLFTAPRERVNRPDFGVGIQRYVFEENSTERAAALRFLVESELQRWLASLIEIDDVTITTEQARLEVRIEYRLRRSGAPEAAVFEV